MTDEITQFLKRYINSVETLEVFLLVEAEQQAWTGATVSARLGLSGEVASRELENLTQMGLLRKKENEAKAVYLFSPVDPAALQTARKLTEFYQRRRIEVLNAVLANSLDRVSKSVEGLRAFSDAFRIRKDKKDG